MRGARAAGPRQASVTVVAAAVAAAASPGGGGPPNPEPALRCPGRPGPAHPPASAQLAPRTPPCLSGRGSCGGWRPRGEGGPRALCLPCRRELLRSRWGTPGKSASVI